MICRSLALLTTGVLGLAAADAAADPPELRLTWTADARTTDFNWADVDGLDGGVGSLNPLGEYQLQDGGPAWTGWNYAGALAGNFQSGGTWQLTWNCVFNDDALSPVGGGGGPFVAVDISATNSDLEPQSFSFLVTQPVVPVANPLGRGSIIGTLSDLKSNGAKVAALPESQIYTPRIDGRDQPAGFLFVHPFSAGIGDLLAAAFGTPTPVPLDQPVDESLAIYLEFELSSGDSVSFTAIFEIVQRAAACAGDFDGSGDVDVTDLLRCSAGPFVVAVAAAEAADPVVLDLGEPWGGGGGLDGVPRHTGLVGAGEAVAVAVDERRLGGRRRGQHALLQLQQGRQQRHADGHAVSRLAEPRRPGLAVQAQVQLVHPRQRVQDDAVAVPRGRERLGVERAVLARGALEPLLLEACHVQGVDRALV